MRYLILILCFGFQMLISSCSKEEVLLVVPAPIVSTASIEFNNEPCGVTLSGKIVSEILPSRLGFVVGDQNSIDNNEPLIDSDIVLDFTGDMSEEIFSILYEDVIFGEFLFWRSFAIIDGRTLYSQVIKSPVNLRAIPNNSFDFTVECNSLKKELLISHDRGCSLPNISHRLSLLTNQGKELIELGPLLEADTRYEIENDVIQAELCIYVNNSIECEFELVKRIPQSNVANAIEISNAPLKIAESTGFRIGDYFYMCGGYSESSTDFKNEMWRHDPMNDTWLQLSDFPGSARAYMVSFVINGIAYLGSGSSRGLASSSVIYYDDFYSFDPDQGRWDQIADIPIKGSGGVAFVINDQAYVTNLNDGIESNTSSFFRFDSNSNSWTILNDVPIDFMNSRNLAVSHEGSGYVFNGTASNLTEVFRFDSSENLEKISTIPILFNDAVAVVQDKFIHITTGRGMLGMVTFDLSNNSYVHSCVSNEMIRSEAVGYSYENDIFIIGGIKHSSSTESFTESYLSVYKIEL